MSIPFLPEHIEQWPLARLKPYARNARTHSEDQVVKIAASLVEYGWTSPVMVSADGEIIAGHGRLLAARHLGLAEVPVIQLGHLSPEQVRGYRIADNRLAELSGWDDDLLATELHALNAVGFDLGLTGFEGEDLDRLMAPLEDEGALGEDEIPEPPLNPASRTGDLWRLGKHRLLCGDSTKADDVQRVMAGERAILFATDPPYLVGYDGTNHPGANKSEEAQKNRDWSGTYGCTWDDADENIDLYEHFIRVAIDHAIKPNAAWYCWHASRRQIMVEQEWIKAGAFVHQQIIWVKPKPVLVRMHYLWKHEPCFFGWIKGNRPPKIADAEWTPTVWEIAGLAGDDRPEHPTPKPLDCFAIPMKQHVLPGGICYEPFSGSGSQIMAGETTSRRVFAIEISPQYVDVAVKRWQTATARQAVLEDDGRTFDAIADERLAKAA